jgi:hypothetical protein
LTTGRKVLAERLAEPAQAEQNSFESEMPPYMESFLAHLRLLVGVPFEYMIADPRLLPDESIRFFHLDRSWTDRLVDGAVTVGKIGSREQAHHHAQNAKIAGTLDVSERMVRTLQRGREAFDSVKTTVFRQAKGAANQITGFIMRSGAVSGWPHMEVRAYKEVIHEPIEVAAADTVAQQLRLLRLERLSPGVLLALFEGIPKLVTIEEPHHGIQFGVSAAPGSQQRFVRLRAADGQLLGRAQMSINVDVPVRAGRADVIHVSRLRAMFKARAGEVDDNNRSPVPQTGSAAFAIAVLDPPWRQRFEGTEDKGRPRNPNPPIVQKWELVSLVRKRALRLEVANTFKAQRP